MDLKSVIRPLVPPIIYEAAHSLKVSVGLGSVIRYLPRASFAEAADEAGLGYRDKRLILRFQDGAANLHDMPDFMSAFLASIAIASSTNGPRLKVLDFGGGAGHYRSYVETAFSGVIQTEWLVVETPEQVALNSDVEAIEFSSSIVDGQFDLAIFSGSLQYVDDWKEALLKTRADFIFIARTPIADNEKAFLQIRNGHGLSYPGRVIPRRMLFGLVEGTHDLFASWTYEATLGGMGKFEAPAMLWRRKVR
jgi:putative methyltransferase (TIGR04325 family)